MAIVDRESADAFLASLEAEYGPRQDEPGTTGAAARGLPAYKALCEWLWAEMAAGTDYPVMTQAAACLAGSFLASAALTTARPGAEQDLIERVLLLTTKAALVSLDKGVRSFVSIHEGSLQ